MRLGSHPCCNHRAQRGPPRWPACHDRQCRRTVLAVGAARGAGRLEHSGAVARAGHALVLAAPPEPGDCARELHAGDGVALVQTHAPPDADRPPQQRPEGPGRGDRACRQQRRGARAGGAPHRPLCARDRAVVQRLHLFPHWLFAFARHRAAPVPRAHRLCRRSPAARHLAQVHARVRHEPPQQHGLHPRVVPRRRESDAVLCRGRMGAHLGLAAVDPLDGCILRAAQFRRSAVPRCAVALCANGHRGRRDSGDVSRRRADARWQAARAALRSARLHA